MNEELKSTLGREFFKLGGKQLSIQNILPVSGGDINDTYKLVTSEGNYFLKLNNHAPGTDFFDCEAKGLQALKIPEGLYVPQHWCWGSAGTQAFLLMDFIETASPQPDFWQTFGSALATLHQQSNTSFGWETDNYIGSLRQQNSMADSWSRFYAESRIIPLANKAFQQQKISLHELRLAEKLCDKFPDLIPEEKPALLHGDLWAGNFMVCNEGPAIYDPAVYYGHRETDLAMTRLFGGFRGSFYAAYHEHYPLEPQWQERIPLFQIYPLLVHLVLFGGHYRESVISIIKKFI